MLACGLATHFVLSKDLLLLENALSEVASSDASTISRVISGFSSKISLKKESAYRRLEKANKELKDCLIQDYTIVCHMFRRTFNPDFIEGSRAKLFEKGKQPKWEPSKLELVRDDFVNQYFEKVDDADWEYLQLPARSNLAKTWESKL
ncbi:hypothetical protein AAG906_025511 [Vitis piasezkii]